MSILLKGQVRKFVELIAYMSNALIEKHRREISKNSQSLKDVSLEIRKKEANPASYLARYE
jgi:hypothetical protein